MCIRDRCVKDDVAYLVRMEAGVQTPEETLTKASGSCRDSGWLLVQILRRPGIAAPISGLTDIANVEFDVTMSVTRIHEDPRVTRPYTDAQWAAIDALGERVDAELAAADVRLTQGGEPTFVAVDAPDEPEWKH